MSNLIYENIGSTAVLTLNRPAQRNALSLELRDELAETIPMVRDDPRIKSVILTGAGGNFCSGGDIKTLSQSLESKRDIFEGRTRITKIHRWFDQLLDLEKPVIAAVDGSAFGAGMSLALAADFVIASTQAKFCSVFARLGYVPDMGLMYLLPRSVGLARAKELVFTARVVEASEAKEIGLVQQLCAPEDLLNQALEFAGRFDQAPTESLGIVKTVMNRAFETDRQTVYAQEAMLQSMCRESDFHHEAVRRFMNKEPALYQWPE